MPLGSIVSASANGGKNLRGFGPCSLFSAGMQPGNLTSADTKNYFYLLGKGATALHGKIRGLLITHIFKIMASLCGVIFSLDRN